MNELSKRIVTGVLLALFGLGIFLYASPFVFSLLLAFIFLGMAFELKKLLITQPFWYFPSLLLAYISFPLFCIFSIFSQGSLWLLWLVVVVASTDVCAFIAGKTLGKRKIAPKISPNKTWEGLVGGMLGATFFGLLVAPYCGVEVGVFLPAILAVCSQIGDFFESHLKRKAGVKDSGNLLPGHGGLLDRFDGLLFAAPVLFLVS